MKLVGGEGERGGGGWLGSRSVSTPPSDEQREVWGLEYQVGHGADGGCLVKIGHLRANKTCCA